MVHLSFLQYGLLSTFILRAGSPIVSVTPRHSLRSGWFLYHYLRHEALSASQSVREPCCYVTLEHVVHQPLHSGCPFLAPIYHGWTCGPGRRSRWVTGVLQTQAGVLGLSCSLYRPFLTFRPFQRASVAGQDVARRSFEPKRSLVGCISETDIRWCVSLAQRRPKIKPQQEAVLYWPCLFVVSL